MYEKKSVSPIERPRFVRRLLAHALLAFGIIGVSLAIGMAGYCGLEHLDTLDGFLNTAMLLGGMGPVNNPATPGGKLFAGLYALYCGLVVIAVAGIVLAPVAHRILHRFHLEEGQRDE